MKHLILEGLCPPLGWQEGDRYVTHPDCLTSLQTMELELIHEDIVTRNVRKRLGMASVIQKDLLPILINVQDKILLSTVVRVLVNLTMPVECLLPTQFATHCESSQETIWQFQLLLLDAKRSFLDVRATNAIVQSIRDTLHYSYGDKRLSEEDCLHINNVLLLIRNILHSPDQLDSFISYPTGQSFNEWKTLQNKLVWNFFAQGLDIAILLLINNKNRVCWNIAVVQLIALLYKDQHVTKIQKLLELASDISESSEDDIDSDTSKHSSTDSRLSSCGSTKGFVAASTSDSGYPWPSEDWSSYSGSPLIQNSSPFRLPTLHKKPSSQNSSVDDPCLPMKHYNNSLTSTKKNQRGTLDRLNESNVLGIDSIISATPMDFKCNVPNNSKIDKTDSKVEDIITSDLEQTINVSTSSSSDEELKHLFKLDTMIVHSDKQKHQLRLSKTNNESDSSNDDDEEEVKHIVKARSHPPVGWKCKGVGDAKYQKCSSWICLDAALEMATRKGWSVSTKEALLEKRRKVRLVAGQLAHTPTDEDINNLLKDFTMSFLHNGFGDLVMDSKNMMIAHNAMVLDKSHFLWLLTYFLRLASTMNLGFHHISCILSANVVSYLTYEGVMMCEELESIVHSDQVDVQPLFRRLHLLVIALRELFNTIDIYCKKPTVKKEKKTFHRLKVNIAEMVDVRQLFLLLIRNYSSLTQSKQYLIDLISTNHLLLVLLENVYIDPETCKLLDLPAHINQFATIKVMEQYGKILEDFKVNSEFVNDCVFTMMHHVVGEGRDARALFHPTILQTFCKILEEDAHVSEICEDLMNYTLSEFMRATKRSSQNCVRKLFGLMTVNSDCGKGSVSGTSECSFNGGNFSDDSLSIDDAALIQDDDSLYWWYLQFQHHPDVIGSIQEGLIENQKTRTRKQILQDLWSEGLVNQAEYQSLKCKELEEMEDDGNDPERMMRQLLPLSERDTIFQLIRDLIESGFKLQIYWLQKVLLETCYVKAGLRFGEKDPAPDPVLYYSYLMNQSLPLVPYNEYCVLSFENAKFMELLHALHFDMPSDVGKAFPRIPSFWSVDHLYSIALRLGPLSQQKGLKFKICRLEEWLQQSQCNTDEMVFDEDDRFQMTSPGKLPLPGISAVGPTHLYEDSHLNLNNFGASFSAFGLGRQTSCLQKCDPAFQRRKTIHGTWSFGSSEASKALLSPQRRESFPGALLFSSGAYSVRIPAFGPSLTNADMLSKFGIDPHASNLNWLIVAGKSNALLATNNNNLVDSQRKTHLVVNS